MRDRPAPGLGQQKPPPLPPPLATAAAHRRRPVHRKLSRHQVPQLPTTPAIPNLSASSILQRRLKARFSCSTEPAAHTPSPTPAAGAPRRALHDLAPPAATPVVNNPASMSSASAFSVDSNPSGSDFAVAGTSTRVQGVGSATGLATASNKHAGVPACSRGPPLFPGPAEQPLPK